ncbi:MAG: type II toxin-antitoxin system HicA family toxin [Alphaproteobacteria bacterium]|nr:type II toxin-antitoxin system HicA family toxin [Alphaproteobacteria bacterium]
MKKQDLEKQLKKNGFSLKHGSKHDRWVKEGNPPITVPRHNEIDERLAKKILKDAGIL